MTVTKVETSASGTRITLEPDCGAILLSPDGNALWSDPPGIPERVIPLGRGSAYEASQVRLALVGAWDCHVTYQDILNIEESVRYPIAPLHPLATEGAGLLWRREKEGTLLITIEGKPVATISLCRRCREEIKRWVRSLLRGLPGAPV